MRRRIALVLAIASAGCRSAPAAQAEPRPVPSPVASPVAATTASLPIADASTESTAMPVCADGGALACASFERYVNHKFGFAVDIPSFFVKKAGDADGRGQPFEYGSKARIRAWAMFDNPPMTVQQLYGDWTRRDGVTFKAIAMNTWIVRGKEQGRLYYSRSILADRIIATIEVSYVQELADAFEPVIARMGASLMTLEGEGMRARM